MLPLKLGGVPLAKEKQGVDCRRSTTPYKLSTVVCSVFGTEMFENPLTGKHVILMIDNITALSDINNMATCICVRRNSHTKSIWIWCHERNIWFMAVHILRVENVEADQQSKLTQVLSVHLINRSSVIQPVN